jgi:probable HAF family extracellular repeat protein
MRDLGTLGGTFGTATALNDAGEVVGGATTTGDSAFHAFFWKGGVMTDLGTVAGYDCTQAFGINSRSQVVGQAVANGCAGPGAHAFLWEDGHIIDLNVFVPPDSELTLGDVEHINDQGEMFGNAALPNGDVHAFVLIPCDEHHPGVEGCDYSLVDAIPVAQASAVSRDVIRGAQRLSPPPRTNEFHMPGFTIGPRN